MKNKNNITPLTVKTIPKPGRVTSRIFSVDIRTSRVKDESVMIKNVTRLKKDSGQKVKEVLSVRYRVPYIDPEFVKLCYEGVPEHTRCLKFKANCIVGGGWDIEPDDPELKNFTADPEYKLLDDFSKQAVNSNEDTFLDVLKSTEEDYLNYGFGLLEIIKNKEGKLGEVYYFPSYEARIVYDGRAKEKLSVIQLLNSTEANKFSLFNEKNFRELDSTVVLLRNINPFDRFYGFPEWYPSTSKLAITRAIDEYNLKLFRNDLMVSFALIIEGGELAEGQDKAVQEFLQSNYKGVQNAAKALLLTTDNPEVKIRIEKVTKDGREGSFTQTQDSALASIIISHGVVASLLGISKPGKLGNTSENYDLFQVMNETIIRPEQQKLESKINNLLRITLGITKFHITLKELRFEKLKEMAEYSSRLVQDGTIDTNEARVYHNYKPREDEPVTAADKINALVKQVKILKQQIESEE